MECFIIVQGQSETKAAGYLDPASPTAIFVHYSCMDFHEEKKPMLCSTLKTFEKKKELIQIQKQIFRNNKKTWNKSYKW